MIDTLLSYLAPHLCCSCDKIGSILCEYCKYNIADEAYTGCISCGRLAGKNGICRQCRVPYVKAWCVGEHAQALHLLISNYKFHYAVAAHQALAELLLMRLDDLPDTTIVIPVPTVTSHIRMRGYDHTRLLARAVAKKRRLRMQPLVRRVTTTTQRGAGRRERIAQARRAFTVTAPLDPRTPYLLIDDVVTTGATLHYAAQALRKAGAREIWVAAIARQPLD